MVAVQLRAPLPADTPGLLALAQSTGLFAEGEVEDLLGTTLASFHSGELGPDHAIRVAIGASGDLLGWLYLAPTEVAEEPELLWVGVEPSKHRAGTGTLLLAEAERLARAAGGSVLRVSTSSLPATAPARALYERRGFARVEVVPDYYGPGDDAVRYTKQLMVGAAHQPAVAASVTVTHSRAAISEVAQWGRAGHLTAAQTAALKEFLQQCKAECGEDDALRWLRARSFHVAKALALRMSCLEWWSQVRPTLVASRNTARRLTMEKRLVVWMPTLCSCGRSVVAVDCAQHVPADGQAALPVFFLCLDAAIARSPPGDLTVVFDVRKFGRGNMDTKTALAMVKALNAGYPERLGCAYILGAPRVFIALWNIVRVALDARTRSKVCFLRSPEELAAAVGAQALPPWMGGTPGAGAQVDDHLRAFLERNHEHMCD